MSLGGVRPWDQGRAGLGLRQGARLCLAPACGQGQRGGRGMRLRVGVGWGEGLGLRPPWVPAASGCR